MGIVTADAELARLKERVAELEATVAELRDGIDQRAHARAALLLEAVSIAPAGDYRGMADAEVRAHAVGLAKGADFIEGRSEGYIEAHFDALLAQTRVDPVRLALSHRMRSCSGRH